MQVNSRGEFEPFKMLIGAIMALVVLVIILAAIEFFNTFNASVSTELFYTGLRNAIEQPNGKTLVIKNLRFESGTVFTASSVSRQVGLATECLYFKLPPGTSQTSVQMENSVEINAFSVCYTNESTECDSFDSSCQVCCYVGFGVDPNEP